MKRLLLLTGALAITLPAPIQCIHRLPPIHRTYREETGIGLDLVAGDITIADGRTSAVKGWRLITQRWRSIAVSAPALIAIDPHVIERSAAPNAALRPTHTVRDLLKSSGGHISRYELPSCAPNRCGFNLYTHRC